MFKYKIFTNHAEIIKYIVIISLIILSDYEIKWVFKFMKM